MEWYNYPACFFAGVFIANAVPHFVQGVSGNKFPTPFAKPPGKGSSSPVTNILWALLNLFIGFLLFGTGRVCSNYPLNLLVFFAGIAVMSIMLGKSFQNKHKE